MRRRTQIAHSHPKIVSWIPTGYLIRGNKKKAEAFLMEQRQTFQLPAEDTEAVEKGELFADYLERWLKIAKSTIAITTYSSYDGDDEKHHRSVVPQNRRDLKALICSCVYLGDIPSLTKASLTNTAML